MVWSYFFRFTCFLVLGVFAVHFASIKSPGQHRGVASEHRTATYYYDASFKL